MKRPELELRGQPRRVTRYRPAALIALALGFLGLVYAATLISFSVGGGAQSERPRIQPPPRSTRLDELPKDYEPIATTEQRTERRSASPQSSPSSEAIGGLASSPAPSPELRAEVRPAPPSIDAAELAARSSPLFHKLSDEGSDVRAEPDGTIAAAQSPAGTVAPVPAEIDALIALATRGTSSQPSQTPQALTGAPRLSSVSAQRIAAAPSAYTASAGTIIEAALITGVHSDLPGVLTAQVTAPVYDSATGRHLLIPQGARLIGSYSTTVGFQQERAMVIWRRIIFPDGSSIELADQIATDRSGFAGLEDEVDAHSWTLIKGVALATLLGVGAELATNEDDGVAASARDSAQDASSDVGESFVERMLDVQPTLTVRPGWPLRVVLGQDLVLQPYQ